MEWKKEISTIGELKRYDVNDVTKSVIINPIVRILRDYTRLHAKTLSLSLSLRKL